MNEQHANKPAGRLTRRRFLRGGVAAACLVVPGSVLGAPRAAGQPPSQRLNVAGVGLGARGLGNMEKCDGQNVVALCDVDWRLAATALDQYPDAAKYKDFRTMLDKEPGIDAVVISTPDHTHAVIAAEAMKRGKHVYVETPLAHDVWEARQLARTARETGVTTQMGNERRSCPGFRQAVEMLWGGGLGPIRQVHCWTDRPQWPQGMGRPASSPPTPEGLAWDLWLGPAPERSYDPAYHPYRWRGWVDFGTGALGAMGCQLLDVAFLGLELEKAGAFQVSAESTGAAGETYPAASTIRYRFPAREDLPPVEITWYDGGRQPPAPAGLPYHREIGSNGVVFLGEEHTMIFGPTVFGTNPGQVGPRTLPEFTPVEPRRPYKKMPAVKEGDWVKGNRHIQEWISACKSGDQCSARFEQSGPLAEMILLGNAALRAGRPIAWDAAGMQIQGDAEAGRLIHREYRKGWTL
jgi:predicted dehydrogenase